MTPQPIPQPGDRATNYRLGVSSIVVKVGKGRTSDTVYVKLEGSTRPFPLADTIPGPEYLAPLTPADVDAIAQMIQECLQSGDVRDLTGWTDAEGWHEPIQATLTAGQKRQVLAKLMPGERKALKAILSAKDRAA